MTDPDLSRERVLLSLVVLFIFQLVFSVLLYILGGEGDRLYGDTSGLKYYAGAYYAATLELVLVVVTGIPICYIRIRCDSQAAADSKFRWPMLAYWIWLALTTVADIICVIIVRYEGFCFGDDCIYKSNTCQNNGMAIAIFVTLLELLFINVAAGAVPLYFCPECFGITYCKGNDNAIGISSSRELHNVQVQQQPERRLTPTAPASSVLQRGH